MYKSDVVEPNLPLVDERARTVTLRGTKIPYRDARGMSLEELTALGEELRELPLGNAGIRAFILVSHLTSCQVVLNLTEALIWLVPALDYALPAVFERAARHLPPYPAQGLAFKRAHRAESAGADRPAKA